MQYRELMFKKMQECTIANSKQMSNGTVLFKQVIENEHVEFTDFIFHPLNNQNILSLEKDRNYTFPEIYKRFLSQCNGCYLFNGNFYIYGKSFWEKEMSREEMIYQPLDLITETDDPPFSIDANLFYFGGTPESVFVFTEQEKILELKRDSGKILSSHDHFDDWFVEKVTTTEAD